MLFLSIEEVEVREIPRFRIFEMLLGGGIICAHFSFGLIRRDFFLGLESTTRDSLSKRRTIIFFPDVIISNHVAFFKNPAHDLFGFITSRFDYRPNVLSRMPNISQGMVA